MSMKRVKIIVLLVLLVVVVLPAPSATRTVWRIHGGGMTDRDLNLAPIWGIIGGNFDIILADTFIISPEFFFIVPDYKLKNIYLTPGLTADIKLKDIFLGGGFIKMLPIRESDPDLLLRDDFMLKLNGGIRSERFIMSVFALMHLDDLFNDMHIGVTLGITI
jgi:hypothetical protein